VFSAEEAEDILSPGEASQAGERSSCSAEAQANDRIRCMIARRFHADPLASDLARELYDRTGSIAGVDRDHWMDGGYRGQLHLVPEMPTGPQRRHLDWVSAASRDFDDLFSGLKSAATGPIRYRFRPLALRFFRSLNARTPSAYADGWTIAYNVVGSLNTSGHAVRETMFHEIFHLNDADHQGWSFRALGPIYDGIVARCGTKLGCLKPYAPTETTVRGGTYYAFQPGNGVGEYAAELASRYYREHRALLRKEPLVSPAFKCGPDENARAWALIVGEFFGGVDLVPPCRAGVR
jgi:hypothetical protein